MAEPLFSLGQFTTLVDGLDHPEGVAWGADGNWYAGGEAGQIYRIAGDGSFAQVASTGGFVLGLALDARHNIYACDLFQNKVFKISAAGDVSVYSEGGAERNYVAPNYPVFADNGDLYVSSSGGYDEKNGCVFMVRPDGETIVASEAIDHFPNGMALSLDGRELYIILSNMPGIVKAAIRPDGMLGEPQLVVELPGTVPDGLAFDAEGNLYIACYAPNKVFRLSAAGALELAAEDWQSVVLSAPTNIAFGGPDLNYAIFGSLGRWHLSMIEMPVPGARLRYPDLG
ncbi:MAG: SMP-30/gluconolactonase/LRE family protein [Chloroflexota bacterium]|nr:SMP-30/gluconolactonase/LRE family protein [Chloroflexota bacterium]